MKLPREGHPLKEGLRLKAAACICYFFRIPREGHPLKEGLRPVNATYVNTAKNKPREGHPLKEGLRLLFVLHSGILSQIPERVIH